MKKAFFYILVLIAMGGFLFWPKIGKVEINPEEAIGNTDRIELKEKEGKLIFLSLVQEISDKWQDVIVYDTGMNSEKEAALLTVKKAIQRELFSYLFIQAPKEAGLEIIKIGVKILQIIVAGDSSAILERLLGEFEKTTVEKANKYIMNWLLGNELKVAVGNLKPFYNVKLQDIIAYKSTSPSSANVAINIYSSGVFVPPSPKWGYSWEGGVEELQPFILKITGEVRKLNSGIYEWIKRPEIDIVFDEPVPEFDFKKPSFLDELRNRLSEAAAAIENAAGKISNFVGEAGQSARSRSTNTLDGIRSILSNLNIFRAAVAPDLPFSRDDSEIDFSNINLDSLRVEDLSEVAKELSQKSEELNEEIEDVQSNQDRQMTLEEMQEILDDISEKIDVLADEVDGLVSSHPGLVYSNNESEQEEDKEIADEQEESDEEEEGTLAVAESYWSGGTTSVVNYCQKIEGSQPLGGMILINEVAWMGTAVSASDEWVELKNITDGTVSLSGWQLLDKEGQIKVVFREGGTISAGSFYLLERTDNASVPSIEADLVYSGALNDTNEALYLFDKSCQLQDEVSADSEWPAGDKTEKKSMERGIDLVWHSYSGSGLNGIMGTPKAENSQPSDDSSSFSGGDEYPPTVIFNLALTQASLDFSIPFEITDSVSTTEGAISFVTPSGIDGFIFRWKEEESDWQEETYQEVDGAPLTFSNQKEFYGQDRKGYYFQISAKDVSGNEGDWSPEPPAYTLVDIPKKVLINEIQADSRAGSGGADDDWVELYNPNDFDIDLSQWSIQRTPKSGTVYKKNFEIDHIIPANGYFLIVRNSARSRLLDLADMTCSALQLADDSTVYLVRNQDNIADGSDLDIIDMVGFGEPFSSEGSPASNPAGGESIERKEIGLDTNDNSQDFVIKETVTPTNSRGQMLQGPSGQEIWSIYQHDSQHTGKSSFAGPEHISNVLLYDLGLAGSSFTSVLQPVIGIDRTIYFGVNEPSPKVYAFDFEGTEKWEKELGGRIIALTIGSDNTIYISTSDKGIYALDSDGEEKWIYYHEGMNSASAVVVNEDGVIFFTDYSNLYSVDAGGDEKWVIGGAPRGGSAVGGPVLGPDGTIYVAWKGFQTLTDEERGRLSAYNPDGIIKWQALLQFRAGTPVFDSANSIIYVAVGTSGYSGTSRQIYAFNLDGTERWKSEREYGSLFLSLGQNNTIIIADNWQVRIGESWGSDVWQPTSQIKAFDPDGNLVWLLGPESSLSIDTQPITDKDGNIYFGRTVYEENHSGGGWWFRPADYRLYSVDSNGIFRWLFDMPGSFLSYPTIGDSNNIITGVVEESDEQVKIYSFGQ